LLALVGSFKYLPVIKHGHNTYPIDGFSQLETSRTRAGISHRHGRDDTRGYILRLNDPITEVSLRAVNSTDGAIRRGDHLMVDSQVHLPSRPPKVVRKQTPKTDFPAMFFRGVSMAIVGSHSWTWGHKRHGPGLTCPPHWPHISPATRRLVDLIGGT
jgi:hypothetical protein